MTKFAIKTVALLAVFLAPVPILYWIICDGSTDFGRSASAIWYKANNAIVGICAIAYALWLAFVCFTTVKYFIKVAKKKEEDNWSILDSALDNQRD